MTSNGRQQRYPAPSHTLLRTEHLRSLAEATSYVAHLPTLSLGPRGDGHPVLVFPGLLGDDSTTGALRHVLRRRGYQPFGWGLGGNLGPTRRITEGVVRRLAQVHERTGEAVSLVGWSLGGVLARELARITPERVRCVITLGSPFRLTLEDPPESTHAGRVFHSLRPWHTDFLATHGAQEEEDRPELGVPATSIYSRIDGIVPWQACRSTPGPLNEDVEVHASHLGLGVHPHTLEVVLDRLRQPIGDWRPYAERWHHAS